jgi:hypothetical protein
MERIAPLTNLLTLAPSTIPRPVRIARTCGQFTVRCLKSLARGYIESAMYYPYWGWTGTPPPPPTTGAPR